MAQKPKAHRAPCGTWESTEADARVQFKIMITSIAGVTMIVINALTCLNAKTVFVYYTDY